MSAAQRRCQLLLINAIRGHTQCVKGLRAVERCSADWACQQPAALPWQTPQRLSTLREPYPTYCQPPSLASSVQHHWQPYRLAAGLSTDAWQQSQTKGDAAAHPAGSATADQRSTSAGDAPRRSTVEAFHAAGWTREAVLNVPNALSMGRLISGPVIAYLILEGHWAAAMGTLTVAGLSDWADGYTAKHWGQSSVLGSYLDPLADKVLVCCTVGALAAEGSLPTALAGLIIGRDVLLVGGAFYQRASKLGWRRVSMAEFFRTTAAESETPAAGAGLARPQRQDTLPASPEAAREGLIGEAAESHVRSANSGSDASSGVPPAPFVQPLYISKVNTVLQLGLIVGCIAQSWYGWPSTDELYVLGGLTGLTTVGSFAAYVFAYRRGKLLF